MTIAIRDAEERDVSGIHSMMRDFAAETGLLELFEIEETRLRDAIFGDPKEADCIVADSGNELAGYALFFSHFASFRGQRSIFLEDIYVGKNFRGQKIGERMIRSVARIGAEQGAVRIDLLVSAGNHAAVGFYRDLGGYIEPDERWCKFVDDAFLRLSE